MDFINDKKRHTNLPDQFFLSGLGLSSGRLNDWRMRYGKQNNHNGAIPRGHWLEEWEREKIIKFYREHETDGYRRCTYMMIDQDIVYTSPSSVYRVLKKANCMRSWNTQSSKKGSGFDQPSTAHEHWHMDIANIKIEGVFYFLICVLDGYSRSIIHWDLRESMKDTDVGIVQQAAIEKYPVTKTRFITDNGKQFVGKEFKNFVSDNGLSHVTTSPYYPQSNGKLERFHKTIKEDCIRRKVPFNYDDAKRIISNYIEYYNKERLHSAIGYITPYDMLNGRQKEIHQKRDMKLENRRKERAEKNKEMQNSLFCEHPLISTNMAGSSDLRISAEGRSEAKLCRKELEHEH